MVAIINPMNEQAIVFNYSISLLKNLSQNFQGNMFKHRVRCMKINTPIGQTRIASITRSNIIHSAQIEKCRCREVGISAERQYLIEPCFV